MARRRASNEVAIDGSKPLNMGAFTPTAVEGNSKPIIVILTPVVSSNVHSIGYHDGTLYVKYHKDIKTDVVYQFTPVAKEQYNIIKNHESVGKAIIALEIKGTKM